MIAQHLRYSPEACAVKRLIDDGKLGEIQASRTHVFRRGPQEESTLCRSFRRLTG